MRLPNRTPLVLDVASAIGTTALLLTKELGWRVVGVDLSDRNLREASDIGRSDKRNHPMFIQADAESLPVPDSTFNGLICECSLSTFPDKPAAASEMFRVLAADGRLGISDITLNGPLPSRLRDSLYGFLCVTDAPSPETLRDFFARSGFTYLDLIDRKDALLDTADKLMKALFAAELLVGLKKLALDVEKVHEAKLILKDVIDATREGILSYVTFTARKP
jgi:SAM-dependent methyltransferase